MKRVFVCSPYRRDVAANVALARAACREVLRAGDAPFAPHLLYPALLDDDDPAERALGMEAGKRWLAAADGMQIPQPTLAIVSGAVGMSVFVLACRLVAVFPVLYALGNGLRSSLIPSINLAQMSEFSLVIASLGLALKHISAELMATLTFVFAITSILSTYLIAYNHEIQRRLTPLLLKLGLSNGVDNDDFGDTATENAVVFLGCFREASSILHEIEASSNGAEGGGILGEILVIDFNPQVLQELKRRDIKCLYGDIAHMDTLHHAQIESAKIVACTISDAILGTSNLRLLLQARRLCPHARVIVAADGIPSGADYLQKSGESPAPGEQPAVGEAAGRDGCSLPGSASTARPAQRACLRPADCW